MSVRITGRGLLSAATAVLIMALSLAVVTGAGATHQPANKTAAAGSIVETMGPGERVPVLQERMKVASPTDLILQLTAECDILTELTTGGNGASDSAGAFGQVRMWLEIDGRAVPVTSVDIDPETPGMQKDDGKVVFCNRAHNKSITDQEDDDGTDEEYEHTRTRQANGFNWLALDVGFNYDAPANGNNVVDIVVYAEFTETTVNRGVAEAKVGRRVLIVEPTNASVHEQVQPIG
jgi:hypothetical protein